MLKVNFFAPMNTLGYGIHAYNLIREFERRGNAATLVPPLGSVRLDDEHIRRWLAARKSFDPRLPGVMIFNEEFLSQFCGNPRIGFPVFELERFSPLQKAMIASCDYVFTPTRWASLVLISNGIPANRIRVVNEGFDPVTFPEIEISDSETAGEPFTFAHVGKFEERKGTIQVIRCFARALARKDARLFMHIGNQFIQDYKPVTVELERLGFISTDGGNTFRRLGLSVHFTFFFKTHAEVSGNILARADFGVFPSRAEGWGLPILECLASGVPAIVGRWTGQTEYLSEESSEFIISDDKKFKPVTAKDKMWFSGDRGEWNVIRDDALCDAMQAAFEIGRAYRKTDRWRSEVERIRGFTWARAAGMFETAVKEVCGL